MKAASSEIERYGLALDALPTVAFGGPPPSGPFIVALEGPNSAGKTTLCRSLCQALGAPGCLGTDAAWFTEPFKVRMIRDAAWYASAMFFLSGCFEQMRVLAARPEPLVIMDRSLWSTLAVHAAEDFKRLQALLAMLHPIASQLAVPHLTIVLEASFDTCQSRASQKTGTARALDQLTATVAFHAREQAFYRWLGRRVPRLSFLNVDAGSPKTVLDQALALVREKTRC